jgi:hypothetical protein
MKVILGVNGEVFFDFFFRFRNNFRTRVISQSKQLYAEQSQLLLMIL